MLVGHVRLDAFRRLPGVADGPQPAVELAGGVLDVRLVVFVYRNVAEEAVRPAELLRELCHDRVIGQAFEERFDHLVAPLQRAVGRGYRAIGLELGRSRQQVDTVSAVVKHGRNGRIRVDNDQHVEHFHRGLHFLHAGLGVRGMAPKHHGAHFVGLVGIGRVLEDAVDPAADRNAGQGHEVLVLAFGILHRGKLAFQPVEVLFPDACPVGPGAGGKAVIARQGVAEHAQVGCALNVVVAAEDVGSAAGDTHVAECQLQDAVGAGVAVAGRVLGTAHAPDHGARTVVGQRAGDPLQLAARRAGNAFGFLRCPFGDFGPDFIHAPYTGADELLVFPAIFEDVPENAPDQGNIRTGTETDEFIGMGRGAREARVADNERGIVLLLGPQHVQQRDRMGLGRIAADDEDGLRVVDIVVGVGHGAVAPCVGNPSNGGGVTDTGLVVDVVRAPIGGELAEQIGLFVVMLGGTKPIDAVGPAFVADFHHAIADLVDGIFPTDALPLAAFLFHRIFKAAFAMGVFTHRSTLGAMRPEVERAVPAGLLPDPNAVGDFGDDGAAHRAVGADGFHGLNGVTIRALSLGLGD